MPTRLKSVSAASLVWLLEVDFAGMLFRFSTEPIDIEKDDGTAISFRGGLDDPGYSETLSRFDHSIDQQVISLSLDFGINIAQTVQKGHLLAGSSASLSCVLVQGGLVQQTYEERMRVLDGLVDSPQYAFPDQPTGLVNLSIEASAAQDDGVIIPPSASIQTSVTTESLTPHNGKPYPLIFGTPGAYKDPDGTSRGVPGSPAYIILYNTSTEASTRLVIAGHHVNATHVFVYNDKGEKVEFEVTNGTDDFGTQIAYCHTPASVGVWDNTATEYWTGWLPVSAAKYGGGIKNPWSTSAELTGSGDVIRYILKFSTLKIDHGEFAAVSDYLNRFKVSGYISDFETSPWDWVSSLAEVLPITFRMGAAGIYPIIHDVRAAASYGFAISESLEFQRTGPVQVEVGLSDIYNSISIGYAFDARENSASRYGVTGVKKSEDPSSFSTANTRNSIDRYGQRWRRIESAYVYERSTAQRIIRYISDTEALPPRSIQYRAASRFAFLSLGDIVSLTDSDLGLTNQACFVSSRQWDVDSWIFTLTIDTIPDRDDNSF